MPAGASFFDLFLDFSTMHASIKKRGDLPETPTDSKRKASPTLNPSTTVVQFKKWQKVVPHFLFEGGVPFFQLQVATSETVCYTHLLKLFLSRSRSVFVTGVTGVGKTMLIEQVLTSLSSTAANIPSSSRSEIELQLRKNFKPVQLAFSAQSSSFRTQQNIEASLDKKGRSLYGAPPQQRVAIFVDDVNMPVVEQYGAQPPIELLRLFLGLKGFYDRSTWQWKAVEDTTLLCAAAPPAGGRA